MDYLWIVEVEHSLGSVLDLGNRQWLTSLVVDVEHCMFITELLMWDFLVDKAMHQESP